VNLLINSCGGPRPILANPRIAKTEINNTFWCLRIYIHIIIDNNRLRRSNKGCFTGTSSDLRRSNKGCFTGQAIFDFEGNCCPDILFLSRNFLFLQSKLQGKFQFCT